MENLATRDGCFQKDFVKNPEKSPTRLYHQVLPPRIHAPARLQKLLHGLRASESGYCSRDDPGSFGTWVSIAAYYPKRRWATTTAPPFALMRAEC
jgi:hypothetical protein